MDAHATHTDESADVELVTIIHLSNDEYEAAVDAANDQGGSTEAVVAYLAQWDYGDENDGASSVMGMRSLAETQRLPHQLHPVTYGGLEYWLQLDHQLRFYTLYRAALEDQ